MNQLYEYKKVLPHTPHVRGSEETLIIDGEREFVESYITREEFRILFGGYLITQHLDDPADMLRYRGVWGRNAVRKFKRVLRERGAQFEIVKIDGSERFIKITTQDRSQT